MKLLPLLLVHGPVPAICLTPTSSLTSQKFLVAVFAEEAVQAHSGRFQVADSGGGGGGGHSSYALQLFCAVVNVCLSLSVCFSVSVLGAAVQCGAAIAVTFFLPFFFLFAMHTHSPQLMGSMIGSRAP